MKEIRCEMCGSTDIVKQDGLFVCQSCGIKYTVEEARKMMVEVSGTVDVSGSTVKIDQSQRIENLKIAARLSTSNKNYDLATKQWGEIQALDPLDWEACYYSAHCRSLSPKTGPLGIIIGINDDDYKTIKGSLLQALILLSQKENDDNKIKQAIETLKGAIDEFTKACIEEGRQLDRKALGDYYYVYFDKCDHMRYHRIEAGKIKMEFGQSVVSIFKNNPDIQSEGIHMCFSGYSDLKDSRGVPDNELSVYYATIYKMDNEVETAKKQMQDTEIKAKSDAFWAEHPSEKNKLLEEKSQTEIRIKELENAIDLQVQDISNKKNANPQSEEIANIDNQIKICQKEYDSLGYFALKRNRELTVKINELNNKKADVEAQLGNYLRELDSEIHSVKTNSRNAIELQSLNNRLTTIEDNLKYGRLN